MERKVEGGRGNGSEGIMVGSARGQAGSAWAGASGLRLMEGRRWGLACRPYPQPREPTQRADARTIPTYPQCACTNKHIWKISTGSRACKQK